MPFNNDKNGYINEENFVKTINNKKYENLSFSLQLFIADIFGKVDNNSLIECYKNKKPQKFDILIKISNKIKRISLKKGVKNSVHAEPISEMIHFLIVNKMPRNMIINFLNYHYADGSTNGKGKNRITILEYKNHHQKEIDEINEFINDKKILYKAIDRFVIKGRNSKYKIDAIIYGVPEDFIWIKRKDIYSILISKRKCYSTSIHFSNLTYQPMSRNLIMNSKYEKCRFISQLKWYNISDDIIENMNNRTASSLNIGSLPSQ